MEVQRIIHALNGFWQWQGCAIIPGSECRVSSAVVSPLGILPALSSNGGSLALAYVQPCWSSLVPESSEMPGRHHEYAVWLKPAAVVAESVDLLLDSLRHLGLESLVGSLKVAEAACGLPMFGMRFAGHQVEVAGVCLARAGYLECVGDMPLATRPLVLCYSVEHLAMVLQEIGRHTALDWGAGLTGERAFGQLAREFGRYHQQGDSARIQEARLALEESAVDDALASCLVYPAWEAVLRWVEAFEWLQAQDRVSDAEQASAIRRVCDWAGLIARLQSQPSRV